MEPTIRHRESTTGKNIAASKQKKGLNVLLQEESSPKKTIGQLAYAIAVVLIFLYVFQTNFGFVSSHGHSHDHGHAHEHEENPAFKYSKHANEKLNQKPEIHVHSHDDKTVPDTRNPNLWMEAILSTLLISAAPFFILFLIPIDNSKDNQNLLKILLSFASGGLLGDAFLHLIPHAILAQGGDDDAGGHSHSHSHSHSDKEGSDPHEFHAHDLSVGLWVLIGIITFLLVEKFIRIMKGGHGHSHSAAPQKSTEPKEQVKNGDTSKSAKKKGSNSKEVSEKKQSGSKGEQSGDIKVAGYLNLAADFTHNFTDGLAIGASFLAGRSVGIVTTFTILIHEVPHEIGDFAILIQSGCSKKKAILLQLLTAVGALSGTMVSLLAEGAGDAWIAWILPFTAGGFIYIATVSVIPELLHESTFKQSLKEIVALLVGVYLMVLIAQYE